jgi:hypothetical protein
MDDSSEIRETAEAGYSSGGEGVMRYCSREGMVRRPPLLPSAANVLDRPRPGEGIGVMEVPLRRDSEERRRRLDSRHPRGLRGERWLPTVVDRFNAGREVLAVKAARAS